MRTEKRRDEMNQALYAVLVAAGAAALACCPACRKSVNGQGPAPSGEIVAEGAAVEKLAGGFSFTEGPAANAAGEVYFTDQPNNRIWKWTPGSAPVVWLEPCQRSNGMEFDGSGVLVSCADEQNRLVRITEDKSFTVLAERYNGRKLNGPNDVWVAPDGALYFTDPYYQRPWWSHHSMPQDGQHVYRLSPDGAALTRVISDFVQPNGIAGTPDGRTLYVADIGAGRTWAYAVQADGSLSGKRLLAPEGSDGMTLDERGNVYLTNRSVVSVFSAGGAKIREIPFPEMPANVAFGGPDRKTLFVTARTSVYTLRMNVRGY
jgi:gluconolactonase